LYLSVHAMPSSSLSCTHCRQWCLWEGQVQWKGDPLRRHQRIFPPRVASKKKAGRVVPSPFVVNRVSIKRKKYAGTSLCPLSLSTRCCRRRRRAPYTSAMVSEKGESSGRGRIVPSRLLQKKQTKKCGYTCARCACLCVAVVVVVCRVRVVGDGVRRYVQWEGSEGRRGLIKFRVL
jgi:hypothetical protein